MSYHIFSNTQLQQEVDKLKAGGFGNGPPNTKEADDLREQLKAAGDEKMLLLLQMNSNKGNQSDAGLKQVSHSRVMRKG